MAEDGNGADTIRKGVTVKMLEEEVCFRAYDRGQGAEEHLVNVRDLIRIHDQDGLLKVGLVLGIYDVRNNVAAMTTAVTALTGAISDLVTEIRNPRAQAERDRVVSNARVALDELQKHVQMPPQMRPLLDALLR